MAKAWPGRHDAPWRCRYDADSFFFLPPEIGILGNHLARRREPFLRNHHARKARRRMTKSVSRRSMLGPSGITAHGYDQALAIVMGRLAIICIFVGTRKISPRCLPRRNQRSKPCESR